MSFEDFAKSGAPGKSPLSSSAASPEEKELRDLQEKVRLFTRHVSKLDEDVGLIGGPRDSRELRSRISKSTTEIITEMRSVNDAVKHVQELDLEHVEDKSLQMRRQKLFQDYKRAAEDFQKINSVAMEREKVPIPESQAKRTSIAAAGGVTSEQERQNLLEAQRRDQEARMEQERLMMDEDAAQREEDIARLEGSFREINSMMHDLGTIVSEQGAIIDSIDASVSDTVVQVEEAETHIDKAGEYQKKSRKKILIILAICLGILIFLILIVVVPIVVSTKK